MSRFVRVSLILIMFLAGCDDTFQPKADLDKDLVVVSVLSNDRDIQFVRVSQYYDVTGFDPAQNKQDPAVTGAVVTLLGPSGPMVLRDTLLVRTDTSHYESPIHAYVANHFRPEPSSTYQLTVTYPQKTTVTASVTLPDRPIISIYPGELVLEAPSSFDPTSFFWIRTTLSRNAKGSLVQLFIDYQVLESTGWRDGRTEIPYLINVDTLGIWIATYPKLTRVTGTVTGQSFKNSTYAKMLQKIYVAFGGRKVAMKRAVVRVFQCEQSYYDYYNTVNGFKDDVSIRLDQPEYTSLRGGTGVLGAYTLDSLVHPLPESWHTRME